MRVRVLLLRGSRSRLTVLVTERGMMMELRMRGYWRGAAAPSWCWKRAVEGRATLYAGRGSGRARKSTLEKRHGCAIRGGMGRGQGGVAASIAGGHAAGGRRDGQKHGRRSFMRSRLWLEPHGALEPAGGRQAPTRRDPVGRSVDGGWRTKAQECRGGSSARVEGR